MKAMKIDYLQTAQNCITHRVLVIPGWRLPVGNLAPPGQFEKVLGTLGTRLACSYITERDGGSDTFCRFKKHIGYRSSGYAILYIVGRYVGVVFEKI